MIQRPHGILPNLVSIDPGSVGTFVFQEDPVIILDNLTLDLGDCSPKDEGFQDPGYLKLTFKYELDSKEGPSCFLIYCIELIV